MFPALPGPCNMLKSVSIDMRRNLTVQWMPPPVLLSVPPFEWYRCLLKRICCREHGLFFQNAGHYEREDRLSVYQRRELARLSVADSNSTHAFLRGPSCKASWVDPSFEQLIFAIRVFGYEVDREDSERRCSAVETKLNLEEEFPR